MFLNENGIDVDHYIPDRLSEGYGVNSEAIETLAKENTDLIITVDTGITAVEQVNYANSIGVDMIITDHHECQETIPDAIAVIDPKQEDCSYPFDMLAGVGVTFKLIHALSMKFNNTSTIWKYLDIVAVGTVADIVPLVDENRIITKIAFETMANTWNVGLEALLRVAGTKENDKVTAGIIGFRVAPRLNASGRLGDAKRGVELFITHDKMKAAEIAEELNEENIIRQELEQEIYEQAVNIIESDIDVNNTNILVVASNNWHHGVIGIVASRITEKYYRPSILLCIEDGVATGSARSVDGFSIFDALYHNKNILNKFGGHDMAAGLSVDEDKIDLLRDELNAYAKEVMEEETLIPKLSVDLELKLEEIDLTLIDEIMQLEPFGMGNPEPKFICSGNVKDIRKIGKESNHLKLNMQRNKWQLDGIGFNMSHYYDYVDISHDIKVLCGLNINEWNGTRKPQMILKDIMYNDTFINELVNSIIKYEQIKALQYSEENIRWLYSNDIIPKREDYEHIYRTLLRLEKQRKGELLLTKLMTYTNYNEPMEVHKILLCLDVFKELALIDYTINNIKFSFEIHKGIKVNLDHSNLYKKLFA